MQEKTFIASRYQKNNLRELKKSLLDIVDESEGIMTEMDEGRQYFLMVAYPESASAKVECIVRAELGQYYSYYYKLEYFRKHLNLNKAKPILGEIFVRALVCFDQNLDLIELGAGLQKFDVINLESFWSFRLANMKRRWDELINATNENSISLLSKKSFEDLLTFLITNLESQINSIVAVVDEKYACIYDNEKNLIAKKKIKPENAELWLISTFIKYAPKAISILDNTKRANFYWVNKFFSQKIQYLV